MPDSVWTSEDPQPGDLDDVLDRIDERFIEDHPGQQKVRAQIVVDLDGEDADRLRRIAIRRGAGAREVISELLREAERSAA